MSLLVTVLQHGGMSQHGGVWLWAEDVHGAQRNALRGCEKNKAYQYIDLAFTLLIGCPVACKI